MTRAQLWLVVRAAELAGHWSYWSRKYSTVEYRVCVFCGERTPREDGRYHCANHVLTCKKAAKWLCIANLLPPERIQEEAAKWLASTVWQPCSKTERKQRNG